MGCLIPWHDCCGTVLAVQAHLNAGLQTQCPPQHWHIKLFGVKAVQVTAVQEVTPLPSHVTKLWTERQVSRSDALLLNKRVRQGHAGVQALRALLHNLMGGCRQHRSGSGRQRREFSNPSKQNLRWSWMVVRADMTWSRWGCLVLYMLQPLPQQQLLLGSRLNLLRALTYSGTMVATIWFVTDQHSTALEFEYYTPRCCCQGTSGVAVCWNGIKYAVVLCHSTLPLSAPCKQGCLALCFV